MLNRISGLEPEGMKTPAEMKTLTIVSMLILIEPLQLRGDDYSDSLAALSASAERVRGLIEKDLSNLTDRKEKGMLDDNGFKEGTEHIRKKILAADDVYKIYYPGDLIYCLPVYLNVDQLSINKIIANVLYGSLENELIHIERVRVHGRLENGVRREIYVKRIRELLAIYPVNDSDENEQYRFLELLLRYSKFEKASVYSMAEGALERLRKDARLPILIFLADSGHPQSIEQIKNFDQEKVKKMKKTITALAGPKANK